MITDHGHSSVKATMEAVARNSRVAMSLRASATRRKSTTTSTILSRLFKQSAAAGVSSPVETTRKDVSQSSQ